MARPSQRHSGNPREPIERQRATPPTGSAAPFRRKPTRPSPVARGEAPLPHSRPYPRRAFSRRVRARRIVASLLRSDTPSAPGMTQGTLMQ